MNAYRSLFKLFRDQPLNSVFAHFYPVHGDYDEPFGLIARSTTDGYDAWTFVQERFKRKSGGSAVPKLKNYLNYTFVRLLDLDRSQPGRYFRYSSDGEWVAFNTGLQNTHCADLIATFQKYRPRPGDDTSQMRPDWVFKGCYAPGDRGFKDHFGTGAPELAWYSNDSSDYVFDTSYAIEKDVFDHLFDRAKQRAGMPNAPDEVVRNYLRGAIENLVPKIRRNYKVAIPVWYVEEKRMQLLLPFVSASDADDVSCFLVERDSQNEIYKIKTIFDMDQAYYSARLITRPDKEWLNP
jgi:hypothetical protein